MPTQLQQRKDPAQKGGHLGGNLGAPAKRTSHDHQQSQVGRKKGKGPPWGDRVPSGTAVPWAASRQPCVLLDLHCLGVRAGQPRAMHFWFSNDWDSGSEKRSDSPSQWHCEGQALQVDPGPPLGPPACGPKSSGCKWLHGCRALREKGLGQGDSVPRGRAAARPGLGELNAARPP